MMHSVDCMRPTAGRKAPVVPFAQLPHHIASDPRLSPVDVRVLLALLYYARAKPTCYPGDAAIAARVGRSVPTIQRSLRRLQGLGLIDRTGSARRVIVLCWRRGPAEMIIDDQAPRSSMISPPRSPMISEGDKSEEEKRPEAAAGCGSPPPPSGTETAEASLPSPEEHARFLRDLAGRPRQDSLVRMALANGLVTEAELADLTSRAPHVAPVPATPPDAGSPALALAAPTSGTSAQAAAPTEVATRPTTAAPDRFPSDAANAADPGERPTTGPSRHPRDPGVRPRPSREHAHRRGLVEHPPPRRARSTDRVLAVRAGDDVHDPAALDVERGVADAPSPGVEPGPDLQFAAQLPAPARAAPLANCGNALTTPRRGPSANCRRLSATPIKPV